MSKSCVAFVLQGVEAFVKFVESTPVLEVLELDGNPDVSPASLNKLERALATNRARASMMTAAAQLYLNSELACSADTVVLASYLSSNTLLTSNCFNIAPMLLCSE